jgi:putative YhdH/YhfP family quinone oxidoreductase
MILRRFKVREHERGLLFRDREFGRVLGPGRHWVWDPLFKVHVDIVSVRDVWLNHKDLDVIAKSGALRDEARVVDLTDHERAVVWVDGRVEAVLKPGLHVLWTVFHEVRVETFDARALRFEHADLAAIAQARGAAPLLEASTIEAVGDVVASSSADFEPGQTALVHGFQTGIAFDGGMAEVLRVPAAHLMHVPAGLSAHEAAVIGVPGFTTAMALERFEELGVPRDGTLAISGAGGAVGLLAIAIAARAGYRVAAITRRMDHAEALRQLGAAEVIDAAVLQQPQRPLEKARFAAVIDNVGGPMLSWLLRSMQDGGCVASVGNAAGNTYDGSVLPFIMRRVQMFGVMANAAWPQRRRLWQRLAGDLKPDFSAVLAHVHEISLPQVMDHAQRQLEGTVSGRTLITFP